jgi:hypothetical protein
MTAPQSSSSGTERSAFIKAYSHLDLAEVPDAWGRPMYYHSHVQALWDGWFARATLHDVARTPSRGELHDVIAAALEQDGLTYTGVKRAAEAVQRLFTGVAQHALARRP